MTTSYSWMRTTEKPGKLANPYQKLGFSDWLVGLKMPLNKLTRNV